MSKKQETRKCQVTGKEFIIEPEDFEFYEWIGVPPPTFSPEERMRRRMCFLNNRTFYKRTCDLTGEPCVSLFPQDAEVPVYSPKAWWSDEWDAIDFGQDYDFSKPFFQQFYEFMRKVPQFSLQSQYTTLVNSDYTVMGTHNRNCYMVSNTQHSEDCDYTMFCNNSKHCMDVYMCHEGEFCFQSINLKRCNRVIYSFDCEDSYNIAFSKNLRGCSDCFGCVNLRKKHYHIFNKPYSKDDYEKEIKKYNTGSYKVVQELLEKLRREDLKYPKRYMEGSQNVDVTGNYLYESKNAENCFESVGLEDCSHCQFITMKPVRDCYDMTFWGDNARLVYDCMGAGGNQNNIKFCVDAWSNATNLEYCHHIVAPNNNLFACIGLRNKEYCIFNKQYSKGEYEELVPKIKKHMDDMPYTDKKGRVYKYGEFFPSELSFFGYNETLAYSYLPATEEEASELGLNWKEIETNKHEITKKSSDLPDDIKDVDDSVLKEIIEDESSGKAYRIVPSELQLLRKMNVPLPRKHPNERHYDRAALRNPMNLWHRQCTCDYKIYENSVKHEHHPEGRCPNEFETSYSPDRKEIVYCEACYNAEVV